MELRRRRDTADIGAARVSAPSRRAAASVFAIAAFFNGISAFCQVVIDGSLNNTAAVVLTHPGGIYQITSDLGRVSGPNLFQSFQTFDIATGETAVFTGPVQVHNIVARVTGGSTSTIDGTIDASSFPSVNFFLLNPAGIIFGPGASVNIPGSFYVSTASRVDFGDGRSLSVAATPAGELSMADPVAFGFLGANASIVFRGAGADDLGTSHADTVWTGANVLGSTFHVSAGDVQFSNFGFQLNGAATPTAIDVTAVGQSTIGSLALDRSARNLPANGQLTVVGDAGSNWLVTNSGPFGGGLFLSGGSVSLQGLGGNPNAPAPFNMRITAGNVGVVSSENLTLDGVVVAASPLGSDPVGRISVSAGDEITLINSGGLTASAVDAGSGGMVSLSANTINLNDKSFVAADTFGTGIAGNVNIAATSALNLSGTSTISAGSGNATIHFAANGAALGAAGNVNVTGGAVTLSDSAGIKATSNGAGDAGTVTLDAVSLVLTGNLANGAYLAADQLGSGLGGRIDINANSILLGGTSAVKSINLGPNAGGTIQLDAASIQLNDQSFIGTDTFGAGTAGKINVTASDLLDLSGSSTITAGSGDAATHLAAGGAPLGAAGSIAVTGGAVSLSDQGGIKATSNGAGNAGSLSLGINSLTMSGSPAESSYLAADQLGTGLGGQISLIANTVQLSDGSTIKARNFGPGAGGNIALNIGSLEMTDQSQIAIDTFGAGDGGTLTIVACGAISMMGMGPNGGSAISAQAGESGSTANGSAGSIQIQAQSFLLSQSAGIKGDSFDTGKSGDLSLNVNTLSMADQSYIVSDALGAGEGGKVTVNVADDAALSGNSTISANSGLAGSVPPSALGAAGEVSLSAANLSLMDSAGIKSNAFGSGNAGSIAVMVGSLTLADNSYLASDTFGSGNAGWVQVNAANTIGVSGVPLQQSLGGASISADSEYPGSDHSIALGNAGMVSITGDSLVLTEAAGIKADSFGVGATGSLVINVNTLSLNDQSYIASDSFGTGSGGRVWVAAAKSVTVSGLPVDGGASATFANSDGGAVISAAGTGGSLTIDTPSLSLSQSGGIKTTGNNSGNIGTITLDVNNLSLADQSYIVADTLGAGNGGAIIANVTGDATLTGTSSISSNSGTSNVVLPADLGSGGSINFTATNLSISGGTSIKSVALGPGNAGSITIDLNNLTIIDTSLISSDTNPGTSGTAGSIDVTATGNINLSNDASLLARSQGSGMAGQISVIASNIALTSSSKISSEASGPAAAGDINISEFYNLTVSSGSKISSASTNKAGLDAGSVSIYGEIGSIIDILGESVITTDSEGGQKAGNISIKADKLLVDGAVSATSMSAISSVNMSNGGAAGSITTATGSLTLSNGGVITTNAATGPAGNITLNFPNVGMLFLEGKTAPGEITTSSGSNTGGRISIADPYAIVLNGGRIEALGPAYQAYVTITANEFVKSTDRSNELAVQGQLVLDSQVQDVSKGTDELKVNFADAFGVLISHCAATRGSGQVSALTIGPIRGPYKPISTAARCN